jgi:hypothetical protein
MSLMSVLVGWFGMFFLEVAGTEAIAIPAY